MSFIKEIIPFELHHHHQYRSIAAFVFMVLLFVATSILFIPIFLAIDFNIGAYIMVYVFISAIIYIIILRVTKDLDTCASYFAIQSIIISLTLMYFTGGIISPFVFWFFCIGPITYLYCKEKVALFWTTISIVCFFIFLAAHLLKYPFVNYISGDVSYTLWAFNFLFCSFFIITTLRSFQKGLKKANKRLHESNDKLISSNEELERFAYIASHDLKSPVRSIISFIGLLNKKYENQFDENGKEFLNIISSNANQMHELIEDILEFSRSNNRVIRKEVVDLNLMLKEISSHFTSKNKDAQIIFGELPIIKSDYIILKQVFQNLIENGLKYNKSYKKVISIQYIEQKDSLYFRVKDNGIGIEPVYFDRIFEMFQRLHNKEEYQGTGIGLAICKKSIQQLNGEMWVTSKVGDGSIFHITLPKNNILTNLNENENLVDLEITA